jgi:hypothetical protein
MERKQSFQSGRVWLNVFETQDGQSIVTIRGKDGQCQQGAEDSEDEPIGEGM